MAGYEGLVMSNTEMGIPNTSEEVFPDVATSNSALVLSACLSFGRWCLMVHKIAFFLFKTS
jgi:hypothetical protein